jgi:hypothetical protein
LSPVSRSTVRRGVRMGAPIRSVTVPCGGPEWSQFETLDGWLGNVATPNDRTYRALWLLLGLWSLRHYHVTGFSAGVEAGRDRLLSGPQR